MHCHTQLTKCAVMCCDGCRDSHEVIHTETRGPHIVTDSTFQFQWHRSVPWRMQWRWAGRDRWPLSVTDFTALWEQELHRWRLQQPTLSAFVSVVVSQLLSRTIGSGKLTRPCKRFIHSYNFILQLHTSVYRTTYKICVMIRSNALLSLDSINSIYYWYWHSKSSSVREINGLETDRIRSNIFPLFTYRYFYTTVSSNKIKSDVNVSVMFAM